MRKSKINHNYANLERRINRIFRLNNDVRLETKTATNWCEGCYFNDEYVFDIIGDSCELRSNRKILGECRGNSRKDKKDIIFVLKVK